MSSQVSDDENPLLLKKPKKVSDPLYPDMSEFAPVELTKEKGKIQSVVDWLKGPGVKPHVAIRNFNDDPEGKPQPGIEVGVRVNF